MPATHPMKAVSGPERRIYRLGAVSVAIALLALVVPRFVPGGDGLGIAATAILVFLALLAAAGLVAVFLVVLTLRSYRHLSTAARVAGIAPAVVLVLAFVAMFAFLRF